MSPRKPRPPSIAGTIVSSVDKPRETATADVDLETVDTAPSSVASSVTSPNRESRSIDRKSTTPTLPKPSRAKSAGSDRSVPSTPAKTPRGNTTKRTPAQVKAENAAKKAAECSKASQKLQSPSVESKPLPSTEVETKNEQAKEEFENVEASETSLEQERNEDSLVSLNTEETVSQQETMVKVDMLIKQNDEVIVESLDSLQIQSADQTESQCITTVQVNESDKTESTPISKSFKVEEDKIQVLEEEVRNEIEKERAMITIINDFDEDENIENEEKKIICKLKIGRRNNKEKNRKISNREIKVRIE